MTTDELKAAAERLLACNGELEWKEQYEGNENHDFNDDVDDVAKCFLARLAADEQQAKEDAEPITGHVIASLMPKEQFGEALYIKASFVLSPVSRLSIGGVIGDNRGFNVAIHGNPTITTRGQLRKLLEALEGGA